MQDASHALHNCGATRVPESKWVHGQSANALQMQEELDPSSSYDVFPLKGAPCLKEFRGADWRYWPLQLR